MEKVNHLALVRESLRGVLRSECTVFPGVACVSDFFGAGHHLNGLAER